MQSPVTISLSILNVWFTMHVVVVAWQVNNNELSDLPICFTHSPNLVEISDPSSQINLKFSQFLTSQPFQPIMLCKLSQPNMTLILQFESYYDIVGDL
jgi:hypothetical protein